MTLCLIVIPVLLYSRSCTVIIRCALRGTLLWCPVVHVLYSSCFPSRTVIMMTSYYTVVPLVLHSWSTWTLFHSYGVDYIGQWFDNNPMISTAADHGLWILELPPIPMIILNDAWRMLWWFLLLLPIMDSTYRTCLLRRSLLHDVMVMSSSTSLLMLSSFAVPPGDVVVVAVLICWVCAPVQLRADEYLLYRWWVSRLQPLTPSELIKQFVSARWTLDDDLMILFLRCRTWRLNFVYCTDCILYWLYYCIRTSLLSVCLSPDALPRCGCCIYSAFTSVFSH